jgi:hypothetical protein
MVLAQLRCSRSADSRRVLVRFCSERFASPSGRTADEQTRARQVRPVPGDDVRALAEWLRSRPYGDPVANRHSHRQAYTRLLERLEEHASDPGTALHCSDAGQDGLQ